MMYGGGYMTGSGMETTAMLFSGVNSIFNYGGFGGYYGYDNTGCGCDNSNNTKSMLGWMAGVIGASTLGMIFNKGIQTHQTNVATRNAKAASDMATLRNALKTLGLENVAIETLNVKALEDKVTVSAQEKDDFNAPVREAEANITKLDTKDVDLASVDNQMATIGEPEGYTGATTIEGYIAEWNAAKNDPANQKNVGIIEEKIAALKRLIPARDAWAEPNGSKFVALKNAEEAKETAKAKAEKDIQALETKRQEAYEIASPLLEKVKATVANQNEAAEDDADGCALSRMFGHHLIEKNGTLVEGAEKDDLTKTDLRQLLHQYRKHPELRETIKQHLIDNPDIYEELMKIAEKDGKDDILQKIVRGTAL